MENTAHLRYPLLPRRNREPVSDWAEGPRRRRPNWASEEADDPEDDVNGAVPSHESALPLSKDPRSDVGKVCGTEGDAEL